MRSLIGVIFTIVLFGGACTGSTAEPLAAEPGASAGSGATSTRSATVVEVNHESPLADFLGQELGVDTAALIERQRDIERSTAACMAERGFEYLPRDPNDFMSFGDPPNDDDLERGSDAWIATYGFGLSTQQYPQSAVGDLLGTPDHFFTQPEREADVRNAAYVDGLTQTDRDAYDQALNGLPPSEGTEEGFDQMGCQVNGFNAPDVADNVREFRAAFAAETQLIWRQIYADSRIVTFNADLTSCVADQGMQWTSRNDAEEQILARLSELSADILGSDDPAGAARQLSPEHLAILAEIQADEIALAVAVIDCGGGAVAELTLLNEVRAEYELAFLEANADELAQYAGE